MKALRREEHSWECMALRQILGFLYTQINTDVKHVRPSNSVSSARAATTALTFCLGFYPSEHNEAVKYIAFPIVSVCVYHTVDLKAVI